MTCIATDAAGNTRTASFTVSVAAWVAPLATPPAPDATQRLISVSAATRVNASAGTRAGRVDIGCQLSGVSITRCEMTLVAVVNGKKIVIGAASGPSRAPAPSSA